MHQVTFTLQQNTPIIHFLHDQPIATLRATELKPAFDKWLAHKLNGKVPEHWISHSNEVGKGNALDYKVSITPIGGSQSVALPMEKNAKSDKWETKPLNFPHLLANMGGKHKKEELKNLVMHKGAVVTIRSWHNELLETIKTEFPIFLTQYNFGNRSSKGFGSFICTEINGIKSKYQNPALKYVFDWNCKGKNDIEKQKNLFEAINWLYKCLRSGINQVNRDDVTEFYFKSLMFAFAKQKGDAWDKRSIKSYFYKDGEMPSNKYDYRDWLGLSTEESWGKKYKYAMLKKSSNEIERFASPLFFKPISVGENKYKIYFGVQDNNSEYLESIAGFATAKINVQFSNNKDNSLNLTPAPEFQLIEFLKYALEEVDIEEHLFAYDNKNVNTTTYWVYRDFIKPIFQSISNNLENE